MGNTQLQSQRGKKTNMEEVRDITIVINIMNISTDIVINIIINVIIIIIIINGMIIINIIILYKSALIIIIISRRSRRAKRCR